MQANTMPSSDALRDCSNTASQNSAMEETLQPQRKRPATSLLNNDNGAAPAKRSKLDANNNNDDNDDNDSMAMEEPHKPESTNTSCLDVNTNLPDFSVERLLSVPLDIVFRQVPLVVTFSKQTQTPLDSSRSMFAVQNGTLGGGNGHDCPCILSSTLSTSVVPGVCQIHRTCPKSPFHPGCIEYLHDGNFLHGSTKCRGTSASSLGRIAIVCGRLGPIFRTKLDRVGIFIGCLWRGTHDVVVIVVIVGTRGGPK